MERNLISMKVKYQSLQEQHNFTRKQLQILEEACEMNRDLQVQHDHALQQAQDFPSQGNCLFAEVEDRRVEMERNLISMKVKYQSLQEQHNFTRKQLQILEEACEMNRDLQVQHDHALQQAQDFPSQGNCLFAEVEDRRVEMERNLISMKVKYQSLQEQHNFTRKQLQILEEACEMNRDLQVQHDHALQQAQDFPSQGNCLFAEVEDHEVEMERNLISMKVKYQSLQKQHNFTREQLRRVELQIAADLRRMIGSQGEHDQLDPLPNMLQQRNGEIEEMKVKQLEKPMKVSENSRELKQCNTSEDAEFEHDYYFDLLQMKLENSNKEEDILKNELSLQRMKALFESQRVLEMERKFL
ncbi:protein Spindly-A-like [Thamnophis elegans]|uniref:protein Spindly-A-like n=1 Tax=Thamnophis elegans TaxID=35005 RepID=UPI0013777B3F|nr:protein Spindly-A-like [Thamnophis elegans]XP_032094546.1 protein Spindly-A-like [Thamnophis elegans]